MNKDQTEIQDRISTYKSKPVIWDYWISRELWFVSDGVFLLMELHPIPDFNHRDQIYLLGPDEDLFRIIYDQAKDVIRKKSLPTIPPEIPNQTKSRLDKSVEPTAFLAWAEKRKINIPEPLKVLIPDPIKDSQSDITKQKECQEWLEGLMKNNSPKIKYKGWYEDEAKKDFGVGSREFIRAWLNAIDATGNTNWSKAGKMKS